MSHSQSITRTATKVSTNKIQYSQAKEAVSADSTGIKWLDKLVGEYEFNRYGISAIAILVVGIFAGTAVWFGAMSSPFEIALLIIPTLAVLSMILAVQPMKLLIYTLLVAVIIDISVIVYHLLIWSDPMTSLF